jgi:hypothetical protein
MDCKFLIRRWLKAKRRQGSTYGGRKLAVRVFIAAKFLEILKHSHTFQLFCKCPTLMNYHISF